MLRFNTAFLLKATAVTAVVCLPMAFDKDGGYVWTAFLLPISLAALAATQVEQHGEFEFKFNELPDSVVEISATGGRQNQRLAKFRTILGGACLSITLGFPMLHTVDPEPPEFWIPILVVVDGVWLLFIGCSQRLTVLTDERQFVTEHLLFGRLCWWRRRWQVRDGDFLAVHFSDQAQYGGPADVLFWHALFVCRPRRRHMITSMYTGDRVAPDMERAAERVARLVDLPYEGYRESKVFWSAT